MRVDTDTHLSGKYSQSAKQRKEKRNEWNLEVLASSHAESAQFDTKDYRYANDVANFDLTSTNLWLW